MALTAKQRAFVEFYAGNATEAAIKAGYSKDTARSIGQENLTKPDIIAAIKERETKRLVPDIATREERFKFWTRAMRDEDTPMKERLKASELLGKAEGDFLERVEVDHSGNIDLTAAVRLALLERDEKRRQELEKQDNQDND
ncbi:MAG: terminase small subunit [Synergistaceae bacterium]|nr:terminase small subunit [Synergistaceae bacterium]